MKTARCGITVGSVVLFLFFACFGLESTAMGGEKTYEVKNSVINTARCTVNIGYTDGSEGGSKDINKDSTEKWKSSKCLKQITGTCYIPSAVGFRPVAINKLTGQNICEKATYELKWANPDDLYPSVVRIK